MANLLANINKGLADNSIAEQVSPIVNEALALVSNTETSLQKRLPEIYVLLDKAAAAGGVEKERCGYIIESLYARASEDELVIIQKFEENLA
jgi:hypothetical protein